MATVNEDGSPHNSPLVFLYDDNFDHIYWASHPESKHSKNVIRTGQAYFVAFDGVGGGKGMYVKVDNGQITEGEDLIIALKVHNRFRTNIGKDTLDIAYYTGESPQRMWRASVKQAWINASERGSYGRLSKDFKIEIPLEELSSLWT